MLTFLVLLSNCLLEGGWGGFYDNHYTAYGMPRQKWLTVTNNQPLNLCSYDNMQVDLEAAGSKYLCLTLRIDRRNN